MRKLTADYIFSAHTGMLEQHCLVTDDDGVVAGILPLAEAGSAGVEVYHGVLCPGFINTHCHLELSHLRGQITKHTGFVGFAKELIPKRGSFTPEQIQQAVSEADEEMYRNGIVAVGDICNTTDTLAVKQQQRMHYHSFIELLGFDPARAADALKSGQELRKQFGTLPNSLVPHAPYSVSPELMRMIAYVHNAEQTPITIHNQESASENEFFEKGTGRVNELYAFLHMDISFFKPKGKSALQSYLHELYSDSPLLLVHNTFSTAADIAYATQTHKNLYWCFCPKANLYIENRLPDYKLFTEAGVKITLGTDSLASNDTLSILDEMKTIAAAAPWITTEQLLTWATANGAEALRMQEQLGTFEKGKKPGVLQLKNLGEDLRMRAAGEVVRVL
jgi:cytosine/adenosine deaminase-related metal-dependent hydrolase